MLSVGLISSILLSLCLLIADTEGEPSYYRQYRILNPYSYDYTNQEYVSPNRYTTNDNNVYVTDKYGRTTVASSRYNAIKNNYYTNPYVYHGNRYVDYGSDKVYTTDQYGRTTLTSSSSRLPYARAMTYGTPCSSGTCGQNAHCTMNGGRAVCSCPQGHRGDPLTLCKRVECERNEECNNHLNCLDNHCVDPCASKCGVNANCEVANHIPVCSCPARFTGDPFTSCRLFDPAELCHPSPCGPNTNCEVVNGVPTCKCLSGYFGSPLAGCRHECESDGECGPSKNCVNYKCENPCSQCGTSADCETVSNHKAVCKCPRGYYGNPYLSCRPECSSDNECPPGKPACIYNACKNPCDGACGTRANCELRGLTPVCSCPKDMTGNPFEHCRPFEKRDLCEPNPCGANARCEPGFDRYNKERPVCLCNTGFTGNGVIGCSRGECSEDGHCPNNHACIDYRCENPCIGQCGINAMCNPRNHIAVCTCPPGYDGDAVTRCYPRST